MTSLCNCCMEHSSKSFGTLCFTPDSASIISKVSRSVGDSRTFEFFIIQSTNFCLNDLLKFSFQKMHGLTDHFTSVCWNWAIKCPRFVEAFFYRRYALDILHWSKYLIAWTSFLSTFFDGDGTMDKILYMTKVSLYSVCFCLLPTDVTRDNIFSFFHVG